MSKITSNDVPRGSDTCVTRILAAPRWEGKQWRCARVFARQEALRGVRCGHEASDTVLRDGEGRGGGGGGGGGASGGLWMGRWAATATALK
eukprot:6209904-Pleurochrysis_carterae.AAC.1